MGANPGWNPSRTRAGRWTLSKIGSLKDGVSTVLVLVIPSTSFYDRAMDLPAREHVASPATHTRPDRGHRARAGSARRYSACLRAGRAGLVQMDAKPRTDRIIWLRLRCSGATGQVAVLLTGADHEAIVEKGSVDRPHKTIASSAQRSEVTPRMTREQRNRVFSIPTLDLPKPAIIIQH